MPTLGALAPARQVRARRWRPQSVSGCGGEREREQRRQQDGSGSNNDFPARHEASLDSREARLRVAHREVEKSDLARYNFGTWRAGRSGAKIAAWGNTSSTARWRGPRRSSPTAGRRYCILRELLAGIRRTSTSCKRGLPEHLAHAALDAAAGRWRTREWSRARVGRPAARDRVPADPGRRRSWACRAWSASASWGARWAFGEPRPEELRPGRCWCGRCGAASTSSGWPPGARGGGVRALREAAVARVAGPQARGGVGVPEAAGLRHRPDRDGRPRRLLLRLAGAPALRQARTPHGPGAPRRPTQLVREFPRWLRWSPMADNVRSALASA